MKQLGRILSFLTVMNLTTTLVQAKGLDFGNNSTEFGLFPTTPKTKHLLPDCNNAPHLEGAPGIPAHFGYCLGPVQTEPSKYKNNYAITIFDEFFDKD